MIMKYKQVSTHDRSDTPGMWGKRAALNVLFQMSELDPNSRRKQHLDRVELQENSIWVTPNEIWKVKAEGVSAVVGENTVIRCIKNRDINLKSERENTGYIGH